MLAVPPFSDRAIAGTQDTVKCIRDLVYLRQMEWLVLAKFPSTITCEDVEALAFLNSNLMETLRHTHTNLVNIQGVRLREKLTDMLLSSLPSDPMHNVLKEGRADGPVSEVLQHMGELQLAAGTPLPDLEEEGRGSIATDKAVLKIYATIVATTNQDKADGRRVLQGWQG